MNARLHEARRARGPVAALEEFIALSWPFDAEATAAAQGVLDLTPIIVMGALGAIVGDSTLFWRRS